MCPGKQLVDLAVRMAVDDPGEDVGEVGNRVDVVQLAGFDQRRDSGPMLGATVGAREQRIFPVERDRAYRALDGLLSSSMRPSSMKRVRPSQRESA